MIHTFKKLTFAVAVLTLITSCSETNKALIQNNKTTKQTQKAIKKANTQQNTTQPAVLIKDGFYVNTHPIALNNNPEWLQNRITMHGQRLSLSFLTNHILRNTTAMVNYQDGTQSRRRISINYSGTIRGALDNLATKTNYAYTIDGNKLTWSTFLTKTFDISFMPGNSNYSVGQGSSSGQSYSKNTDISTIQGNLHDDQYSSLKGSLSIWRDLKTTLQNLKSKQGTVEVSESTTSVTVHDRPANVRAIANYIKLLNQRLSRQVLLNVKVLQITLSQSHQFGIDWDVAGKIVSKALKTSYSITAPSISKSLSLSGASSSMDPNTLPSFTIGKNGASNAILRALSEQGKLSIVTEPSVTTLNNQVAEIRISRDTSYLRKVEQSMSFSGSNNQPVVSTTLDPGIVTDGFTLYILPKIQGDRVYLQVSSVISTLQAINTISSATTDKNNQVQIQVPTLQEKRFNIRSLINNRGTLVIAGFKQLDNATNLSKMFGSSALGGRAAANNNIQTVILITPTIIENKN